MGDANFKALAQGTQSVYDRKDALFDRVRDKSLFEKPWLDAFSAHLPDGASVLDLGCGSGQPIGHYFIEKGYDLTGVDYSKALLDLAETRFPQARWIQGDIRNFEGVLAGQRADGIIAWHSLFHLTQAEQRMALPQILSYLGKGGVFMTTIAPEAAELEGYIADAPVYHASLAPDDYQTILKECGLTVLTMRFSDPDCRGASVLLAKRLDTV